MIASKNQSKRSPPIQAHAFNHSQLLARLRSDAQAGLGPSTVEQIREQSGWNELASAPPDSVWQKLLAQFNDVVVWILLAAALVSGLTGELTDTAAIVAIVLLNAILGFYQEERAERAVGLGHAPNLSRAFSLGQSASRISVTSLRSRIVSGPETTFASNSTTYPI